MGRGSERNRRVPGDSPGLFCFAAGRRNNRPSRSSMDRCTSRRCGACRMDRLNSTGVLLAGEIRRFGPGNQSDNRVGVSMPFRPCPKSPMAAAFGVDQRPGGFLPILPLFSYITTQRVVTTSGPHGTESAQTFQSARRHSKEKHDADAACVFQLPCSVLEFQAPPQVHLQLIH